MKIKKRIKSRTRKKRKIHKHKRKTEQINEKNIERRKN